MSDTTVTDVLLSLSAYPGVTKVQLRGRNAAISNSAETVWSPGATYARLSSAVAMEAVSDSANDTSAGTGARTISVSGLDGSYDSVSETVTLNGTTPVALTNTYLAINRVKVLTAGSGLTNAGNVDVRVVSGSAVKARLTAGPLGLGHNADFLYTIPDGYYGLLKPVDFSVSGATGDITAYLLTHDVNGIIRVEGAAKSPSGGSVGFIEFGGGLLVEPKTLIELRVIVSAGAGDMVAMAELFLLEKGVCPFIGSV